MKVRLFKFDTVPFGCLVTRSEHYIKDRCIKSKKKEIGIITDISYYKDKKCGVIGWPSVFWENGTHSNLVHPALVKPFRNKIEKQIKWVEMED